MSRNRQAGAVSLFVVIFAMLIITVITVSFLRLMIADQQQASDNDLSQSAYDSATAGVEDAKRALLRYQQVCRTDATACSQLSEDLATDVCNAGLLYGNVIDKDKDIPEGTDARPGEVLVQQSVDGSGESLNQAYTCVTMKLKTDDYVGTLPANTTQTIPLIGEDGYTFNTVNIKWFSLKDVGSSTGEVDRPNVVGAQPLTLKTAWPSNRPPVLRTQLIQYGDTFKLTDFDLMNSSGQANSATLFLYPSSAGGATNSESFNGNDFRKTDADDDPDADDPYDSPMAVRCEPTVGSGGYACSMALTLPEPINGRTAGKNPMAYLRLTPFYNAADFQVILSDGPLGSGGTGLVKFQNVQPIIDATGRANDLFRRIQVRVDLFDTSFPYPDATVDVTGNFCKDFSVTDTEYIDGNCEP